LKRKSSRRVGIDHAAFGRQFEGESPQIRQSGFGGGKRAARAVRVSGGGEEISMPELFFTSLLDAP
jgi:hypothetical protein